MALQFIVGGNQITNVAAEHAGSNAAGETTTKSPESEIAKTIILTCDVARSLPSRVHVT